MIFDYELYFCTRKITTTRNYQSEEISSNYDEEAALKHGLMLEKVGFHKMFPLKQHPVTVALTSVCTAYVGVNRITK